MSASVGTAFVNGYRSNVIMLSQQEGSRLEGKVRNEFQASESEFYERIGEVSPNVIVDRHGDTPITDVPHSRRMLVMTDVDFGAMIDKMDRLKMIINPDDYYVKAAVWAMGRKTDDLIIAAALGNAYEGKAGGTTTALPSSQKLVAHDGSTITGVNLNVKTLRAVSKKFDDNDVDEMQNRHFAFSSSQKDAMLGLTEVTSSDYAAVKALVEGKVNTFMGFQFVRTQRLARLSADVNYDKETGEYGGTGGTVTAANSRRCIAWIEDGIVLGKAKDVTVDIGPRRDKKLSTQIYVCQSKGATRLEEERVIEVVCSE